MTPYKIVNRVFLQGELNIVTTPTLAKKDFQRTEKLLQYDFPANNIVFDYHQFDEWTCSMVVYIPGENHATILEYLRSNYYQLTPLGGVDDPLVKVNALSRIMKTGKIFLFEGQHYAFEKFATKWRGYLDESPGPPGLHYNFEEMICRRLVDDTIVNLSTNTVSFQENSGLYDEVLTIKGLWKEQMYEVNSFIGALPPTTLYEGDVVKLVDSAHPNYQSDGQCIIFRVQWGNDPLLFKVKSPKNEIFDATASQLELVNRGAVRLYYSGSPPPYWNNIKAEAEFYLLLGLFQYHYNPRNDSYTWTTQTAKEAIANQEGHAILRWKGQLFLISFRTGANLSFQPTTVREATLVDDLVLTL